MANMPASRGSLIIAGIISIFMSIGLGEYYDYFIKSIRLSPWQSVLLANACISALFYLIRKPIREGLKVKGTPFLSWLPGPMILLGAFSLALFTKQEGASYSPSGSSEMLYSISTVTLIPLFEEIVFRGGISPFLSRFAGNGWSIWLAAIVFSVAHSIPTWDRVIAFKIGFPLGPFLLALFCDLIVRRWGKIWPAVLFHSACNGTVYIFAKWNPSWLIHFGGLYM